MKVKPKDDVIYRLIVALKRDAEFIEESKTTGNQHEYLFIRNKGFIDALEWVLSIKLEDENE